VLSIVDCYDALTSDRPYRRELSHHDAVAMICERRGTMYDPRIVDAFLRTMRRVIAAPVTGHGAEARTSDAGAPHSNPLWMSEGAAL
jgi:HD-GYP domain-containing protein (c-di-GMP phosphodiesterase class II)